MKGFVLAAGYGERLRPITNTIPKSLIPVLNLPSICYALFLLREAGIDEVVCNLHYKSEEIIRFFEENDFFGLNISFSMEETILGTGGGLKKCEGMLGDSEFVLINSDVILDIDLTILIGFHQKSGSPATLLLYRTERAEEIGSVGVQGNRIIDFNNILGTGVVSDFVYTGVAVLSPNIFRYLNGEFSSVVDTGYVGLIQNHSIRFFEHRGLWQDIGNIHSYWEANVCKMKEILALKERISKVLHLRPQVISPSSIIGSHSIVEDSVVGRDCLIGEGVTLERAVIFPGSTIKNRTTIKNSVVHEHRIIEIKSSRGI